MLTNIFQIIQLAEITSFTFRTNSKVVSRRSKSEVSLISANKTSDETSVKFPVSQYDKILIIASVSHSMRGWD